MTFSTIYVPRNWESYRFETYIGHILLRTVHVLTAYPLQRIVADHISLHTFGPQQNKLNQRCLWISFQISYSKKIQRQLQISTHLIHTCARMHLAVFWNQCHTSSSDTLRQERNSCCQDYARIVWQNHEILTQTTNHMLITQFWIQHCCSFTWKLHLKYIHSTLL